MNAEASRGGWVFTKTDPDPVVGGTPLFLVFIYHIQHVYYREHMYVFREHVFYII